VVVQELVLVSSGGVSVIVPESVVIVPVSVRVHESVNISQVLVSIVQLSVRVSVIVQESVMVVQLSVRIISVSVVVQLSVRVHESVSISQVFVIVSVVQVPVSEGISVSVGMAGGSGITGGIILSIISVCSFSTTCINLFL